MSIDAKNDIQIENALQRERFKIANSIGRLGLLPAHLRPKRFKGFSSADSEEFLSDAVIDGILIPDSDEDISRSQRISEGLYKSNMSVFPVIAERPWKEEINLDKDQKKLEERFASSVVVVVPIAKVESEYGVLKNGIVETKTQIPSKDILTILVPEEMVDVAKAFESWGIKVVRVGYKNAKVPWIGDIAGHFKDKREYRLPDYESHLLALDQSVFIHGVRLPTKLDVER